MALSVMTDMEEFAMGSERARQEDQEKLEEETEREERIRQESRDGSFFKASEREMRREMQEKGPAEAMRDDLKATKEQVKEWLEDDDDDDDDDEQQ